MLKSLIGFFFSLNKAFIIIIIIIVISRISSCFCLSVIFAFPTSPNAYFTPSRTVSGTLLSDILTQNPIWPEVAIPALTKTIAASGNEIGTALVSVWLICTCVVCPKQNKEQFNFQKFNFSSANSELVHKAKTPHFSRILMRDRRWSLTMLTYALFPFLFHLNHFFLDLNEFYYNSCLFNTRKWRSCCSGWKTCTLWGSVVLNTTSLNLKQQLEWCKMSQCSPRLWATFLNLKAWLCNLNYPQIGSILRFSRIFFSCHSTRNLVVPQSDRGPQTFRYQATHSCALHLVGLTCFVSFLFSSCSSIIDRKWGLKCFPWQNAWVLKLSYIDLFNKKEFLDCNNII